MSIVSKLKDPKRVMNFFYWRYRDIKQYFKNWGAFLAIKQESKRPFTARPHGRSEEVILSLTSHRPRFQCLPWTLECLLRQSVRADRILVWIDTPDLPHITPHMRAMETRGVEFRETSRNLRPFNKIIHTLKEFPAAIIVTVDDDIYYKPTMLEELLKEWSGNNKEIVCHYAERITVDSEGNKRAFRDWEKVKGPLHSAYDIVPYGFGGVLYPPQALPEETLDIEKFTRLCPHADDIWLYWMGRMNGCTYRKTIADVNVLEWPSTQSVGLKNNNMSNGNDKQIQQMVKEYGWPSFKST